MSWPKKPCFFRAHPLQCMALVMALPLSRGAEWYEVYLLHSAHSRPQWYKVKSPAICKVHQVSPRYLKYCGNCFNLFGIQYKIFFVKFRLQEPICFTTGKLSSGYEERYSIKVFENLVILMRKENF
jgi:hypothetical protein